MGCVWTESTFAWTFPPRSVPTIPRPASTWASVETVTRIVAIVPGGIVIVIVIATMIATVIVSVIVTATASETVTFVDARGLARVPRAATVAVARAIATSDATRGTLATTEAAVATAALAQDKCNAIILKIIIIIISRPRKY